MKKLLSLVLVCAMGLGMVSCVESEESPSVEAIRNAKAEQLKALANLANAQAEAAKITANAEAALKAAQTEYQKEMTKEAAEKFAVEIEVIKAQADSAILAAQKASAKYKNEILAQANDQIKTLFGQYDSYVQMLNGASSDLLRAQMTLAKLENELLSGVELANATIEEKTAELAELKARLEVLQAPEAEFAMNVDSLLAIADSLTVAYNAAQYKYDMNEGKVVADAKKAYDEAKAAWANDGVENSFWTVWHLYNDVKDNYGNGHVPFRWAENEVDLVYIQEEELIKFKNIIAAEEFKTEEDVQNAKDALAEAEALVATANKFHAELDPAVEAHDSAMVALALAWKDYKAVTTVADYAADTLAAYRNLNGYADGGIVGALPQYKADTAALNALNKKLEEVQGVEPKVKALTAAVEAAEDAVEAAEDAKDAADKAVKDADDAYKAAKEAQAKIDQTAKPVEYAQAGVVVAQKLTALTAAQAEATKAVAAIAEAEAEVDEAEAELAEFVTKIQADYGIVLSGTATEKAAQIAAAVKTLKQQIYTAEVKVAKSTEALAEAQKAFAEAKAVSTDIKPAEEALVAAEAAARTAYAALEALLHPEADTEYSDWMLEIGYKEWKDGEWIAMYPHGTTGVVNVNPEGWEYIDIDGLLDANEDGNPDYDENNTGDRFVPDYSFDAISLNTDALHTKIADLEMKVAKAKDKVTNTEKWLPVQGGFIYEWKTNTEAKEAELREWVAEKNKGIEANNALYAAYEEANAAAEAARDAVSAIKGELKAVLDLIDAQYTGDFMINNMIGDVEALIAAAEKEIADAEAYLNSVYSDDNYYTNTVAYDEAQIANKKAEIAKLEAEIEHFTAMVEKTKAELDAAVAAYQAE